MFTNFNLTSKMEFCRCHGVLTEKLNGCSSPRKRSRCDASLRSCTSRLETCEGAEPRDGAGGQRARWRAALPRSGPTRPATSNRCTPRGCAPSALCARGSRDFFPARGAGVRVVGHWQSPRQASSGSCRLPSPPRTVTDLSHRLARPSTPQTW